jgi:hypothetical protein
MGVFEHFHDVLHLKIPSYLSVDDDLVKIASPTPTRTLIVQTTRPLFLSRRGGS